MLNEKKYEIPAAVNKKNGKCIPDDEPVFLFRANDHQACAALMAYSIMCGFSEQRDAVTQSVIEFRKWAMENPDKMSEPTP